MSGKTWPSDAVIVVASRRGTEVRSQMLEPTIATCRDCENEVCADGSTIRKAADFPGRRDRVIGFLCVECAVTYDRNTIDALIDDRQAGASEPQPPAVKGETLNAEEQAE